MPTLKQLQLFRDLAHCENMSEYSAKNFVSQTSVSNSLTRLEDELGVQLFDRIGRNISLNQYGQIYLKFVETGIDSIALGAETLKSIANPNSNAISVSVASTILWGELFGGFLGVNPDYSITQKEFRIDQTESSLPQLDVDLIICGSGDLSSPYLDSYEFIRDRVRLYVPPTHPFAKRTSIRLSEAKNEKFICQPKYTGFSKFSAKLFKAAGFEPNIVAECDYALRRDLLKQGIGVVLASDTTLRANFFEGSIPLLVEDDVAIRGMSIYWLKDRPLSKPAELFKDFVIEFYKRKQEENSIQDYNVAL